MNASTIRPGLIGLLVLCAAGCARSGFHSPAIDVMGSYFPAWMVCIIGGLALTLLARLLLIALNLHKDVHPAAVIYPCLMLVFTLATWLLFFQN